MRRGLGLLLGLLAVTGTAAASTLGVAPVRVELNATASTGVITVRNDAGTPVTVQARAAAWSQQDGQDQLTDTREVLVTPPLFTIPPKGHQIVRVALLRKPDPARELAYRLVLAEVPPAASAETTGLRVALRITLPVFVAPPARAAADLTWQHSWLPDGTLQIAAHNRGDAHIQILDFQVQGAEHGAGLHSDSARYLLPGSGARWQLHPASGLARATHLYIHAHTDAAELTASSESASP